MKKRMNINNCLENKELIEIGVSENYVVKEILTLVIHRENFWAEAGLANKYPTLYLEGHYEIIKELCTAILLLDGWKALNHECLFAYLRRKKNVEIDFDYLRQTSRNIAKVYG